MNCMTHPDTPAVTTCVQCATGMCRECVDNGITSDGKALCPACAPDMLRGGILELKQQRRKDKIKLYLSSGIVALGLCFAIWLLIATAMENDFSRGLVVAIVVVFFSFGLVGALSIAKRRVTTPANSNDILFELKMIKYTNSDSAAAIGLFSLMISVVFAFLAGVIVGPMNMCRYRNSIKTCEAQILRYEEMLARYTAPAAALPEIAGPSGAA